MKTIMTLFALIVLSSHAVERDQIIKLLEAASIAQSNEYLNVRDAIVAFGSNAVPFLRDAAVDANISWGQRLAARICFERIAREAEMKALLLHDWNGYPPYQGIPPPGQTYMNIMGPHIYMGEYAIPKCKAAGLWYYYLEQTWKKTSETAEIRPQRDPKFEKSWPNWCRKALEGQPEEIFVVAVLCDRLHNNQTMTERLDRDIYRELIGKNDSSAVPTLLALFETFFKRDATGSELYPGARDETYRYRFNRILDFADVRHAELLEAYITEHPALAELKPRLAEVRARPAPPPVPDPPFRLGTNLVVRPNP